MSIQNITFIVMAFALLALLSFGGYWMATSTQDEAQVDKGSSADRLEAILDRLDQSDARMKRMERSLAAEREIGVRPAGVKREEVEAIVAAALRGLADSATGRELTAATTAESEPAFDLEDTLRKLAKPGMSDEESMALWAMIGKSGQADAVMAYLEKKAKDEANSAEAQYAVGAAYIAQLRSGNLSQQEMGALGTKADAAFDRTLALDEEHWEARYQKAVSLSFWPPILGRQGEARRNFEVLIEQQARRQSEPGHASTHLLLGNLLQQMGKSEEARAAWRIGAELFPQNQALASRLLNSGN
ncbi:MAG: hypothetical protein V3W41_07240 [Planctomycetota bacterium]